MFPTLRSMCFSHFFFSNIVFPLYCSQEDSADFVSIYHWLLGPESKNVKPEYQLPCGSSETIVKRKDGPKYLRGI